MSKYPEHKKLQKVSKKSQAVGEFLDSTRYVLCVWDRRQRMYFPVSLSTTAILAAHYDIDEAKLEAEKREMFAVLTGGDAS